MSGDLCRMGEYVGDRTGLIWCECPRHGTIETTSLRIAEAWVKVHDHCAKRRAEGNRNLTQTR